MFFCLGEDGRCLYTAEESFEELLYHILLYRRRILRSNDTKTTSRLTLFSMIMLKPCVDQFSSPISADAPSLAEWKAAVECCTKADPSPYVRPGSATRPLEVRRVLTDIGDRRPHSSQNLAPALMQENLRKRCRIGLLAYWLTRNGLFLRVSLT